MHEILVSAQAGPNEAKTAREKYDAFGSWTIIERTAQCWFEKPCRGDETLEYEERSGGRSKVDKDQLGAVVNANPRITVGELAAELSVVYMKVYSHLKEIARSKQLDKWDRHELCGNKKYSFWGVFCASSAQQ